MQPGTEVVDSAAEPPPPGPADPPGTGSDLPEHASFEELYAAHFGNLTVQLFAYFGDRQEAQDVVQEAFCRALVRWSRLATYNDPVAWVRRVAWNLATSRWRRTKVAVRTLRRQRVEHAAGPEPDRVALVTALANLPDRQRRVVVLHYLGDLAVDEIADREGVAVGTVKSWLHRGRAALAAQLGHSDPGGMS